MLRQLVISIQIKIVSLLYFLHREFSRYFADLFASNLNNDYIQHEGTRRELSTKSIFRCLLYCTFNNFAEFLTDIAHLGTYAGINDKIETVNSIEGYRANYRSSPKVEGKTSFFTLTNILRNTKKKPDHLSSTWTSKY